MSGTLYTLEYIIYKRDMSLHGKIIHFNILNRKGDKLKQYT